MKTPFQKNKHEIIYNLINSALAGGLVFLGMASSGNITVHGMLAAFIASMIVIITKFKTYWDTQSKEYAYLFNFI